MTKEIQKRNFVYQEVELLNVSEEIHHKFEYNVCVGG